MSNEEEKANAAMIAPLKDNDSSADKNIFNECPISRLRVVIVMN